jgi:long-chain fatty acid transport protein
LSLGATWKLADQSEITLAYVHAFKNSVNSTTSIPAGLGGGGANINMYEDSIGVTYGW